jgi:dienelactone hydrolase
MRRAWVAVVCSMAVALAACQQDGPQTGATAPQTRASAPSSAGGERVTFPPFKPANLPAHLDVASMPDAIPATLRLPTGEGRFPAVVILHGSGGVDGRGEQYARALAAAGIASLEVDMWGARAIANRDGIARRPWSYHAMTDAYGALRFLSAHPRISADQIGAMGMSFGANMSVFVASERVGGLYGAGGPDFRAAVPIYPSCYAFEPGELAANLVDAAFPRIPLLVMIGDRDDYDNDGGASCRNLVSIGTAEARRRASIHVVPGATHAWDRVPVGGVRYQDPAAFRRRGGMVYVERDEAATRDSIQRTVAFFRENLSAR